ncbi:hypothetical protein Q5752_004255 [Cryptotrichosporon argae]
MYLPALVRRIDLGDVTSAVGGAAATATGAVVGAESTATGAVGGAVATATDAANAISSLSSEVETLEKYYNEFEEYKTQIEIGLVVVGCVILCSLLMSCCVYCAECCKAFACCFNFSRCLCRCCWCVCRDFERELVGLHGRYAAAHAGRPKRDWTHFARCGIVDHEDWARIEDRWRVYGKKGEGVLGRVLGWVEDWWAQSWIKSRVWDNRPGEGCWGYDRGEEYYEKEVQPRVKHTERTVRQVRGQARDTWDAHRNPPHEGGRPQTAKPKPRQETYEASIGEQEEGVTDVESDSEEKPTTKPAPKRHISYPRVRVLLRP